MAIGKGSMARAAKAPVKKETAPEVKVETKVEAPVIKEEEQKPVAKKTTSKAKAPANPAAKSKTAPKSTAKSSPAKKEAAPKATTLTPTKQVMDMVTKDRIEIGDEMPVYFL